MSKFYGQAWIEGNSLVQEVITFTTGSDNTSKVEVLIADIWTNLKGTVEAVTEAPAGTEESASGNDPAVKGYFQSPSNPKFFYWKIRQTPVDGTGSDFYLTYPCPEPGLDVSVYPPVPIFNPPYDPSDYDENAEPWAYYWVGKLKEAADNYEKYAAIQRKEVLFPGTSYVGQSGDTVIVPDTTFINNDLGDISNLLRLF